MAVFACPEIFPPVSQPLRSWFRIEILRGAARHNGRSHRPYEGSGATSSTVSATHQDTQSKLLRSAELNLLTVGNWSLNISICAVRKALTCRYPLMWSPMLALEIAGPTFPSSLLRDSIIRPHLSISPSKYYLEHRITSVKLQFLRPRLGDYPDNWMRCRAFAVQLPENQFKNSPQPQASPSDR